MCILLFTAAGTIKLHACSVKEKIVIDSGGIEYTPAVLPCFGNNFIYLCSDRLISYVIACRAKLLKCDRLMRRAFFLNSGQKLLDPDWLRRFILSIRRKYQKYTQ